MKKLISIKPTFLTFNRDVNIQILSFLTEKDLGIVALVNRVAYQDVSLDQVWKPIAFSLLIKLDWKSGVPFRQQVIVRTKQRRIAYIAQRKEEIRIREHKERMAAIHKRRKADPVRRAIRDADPHFRDVFVPFGRLHKMF